MIEQYNPDWFKTPLQLELAPPQAGDMQLSASSFNGATGSTFSTSLVNQFNYTSTEAASLNIETSTTTEFSRQNTFGSGLSGQLSFQIGMGEHTGADASWRGRAADR